MCLHGSHRGRWLQVVQPKIELLEIELSFGFVVFRFLAGQAHTMRRYSQRAGLLRGASSRAVVPRIPPLFEAMPPKLPIVVGPARQEFLHRLAVGHCVGNVKAAEYRVEIMFGRLKDWRRVATRYDRCPKVFLSAITLAATVIYWL